MIASECIRPLVAFLECQSLEHVYKTLIGVHELPKSYYYYRILAVLGIAGIFLVTGCSTM